MHILVTGGTGFIGAALLPALQGAGHELVVLSRRTRQDAKGCRFITQLDEIESSAAIGAVINLAGASLAAKRWTPRRLP